MNTDHSFASAEQLHAVREAAFADMMDVVCQRHPHYQSLMQQQGLARSDFKNLSDLAKLPLTHKADYMAAPERFSLNTEGMPLEMQTVWDTMYTTGSTGGKPTPFVSTSFDFFNILALQRNMLRLRGVHRQDVIANLFPLTPAPHGAWIRVLHAAASLNVRVFSAMPGQASPYFGLGHGLDEVVQLVQSQEASVLWGVPSYVYRVLVRAAQLGLRLPRVRLVFVTGEAMGEQARTDMQQALQQVGAHHAQISISYGATEFQGGLVECTPGAGFHNPLPGQLLIEVVDPHTHQPVPDGQAGWVVLTHLQRRGTVLLRYALGDTSVRTQQPCPHCGAITDRLVQTPNRVDALLKIKGMLVNPAVVVAALDEMLGARAYQVQVLAADPTQALAGDVMHIWVEGAHEAALQTALIERVKQVCGITAQVSLGANPSSWGADQHWKRKKFVDLRGH
ncbi:MAG: phenylacetate--CoA ligase family protein [Betaproteobacteria bacterium]|nr:phenylacetate--CoA ligase family protein [Betaproteobacteria bacterium]